VGYIIRWAILSDLWVTLNRTERTKVVRFPRNRNRTGTEFLGSGSFGSGSRFFRFGSRFPVLFAQGYAPALPSRECNSSGSRRRSRLDSRASLRVVVPKGGSEQQLASPPRAAIPKSNSSGSLYIGLYSKIWRFWTKKPTPAGPLNIPPFCIVFIYHLMENPFRSA
jgi:hypothetical protein